MLRLVWAIKKKKTSLPSVLSLQSAVNKLSAAALPFSFILFSRLVQVSCDDAE